MLLFDTAEPATPNPKAVEIVSKITKATKTRKFKTLAERFWSKVHVAPGEDCWLWTASVAHTAGYGKISVNGATRSAHRVAFELSNSVALRPSERVLHSPRCTSKLCCKPAHLRRGSQAENIQDAARAGAIGKRKLTADLAREIVARYRGENGFAKHTCAAISKIVGTSTANIQHVLKGRTWSKATGLPPSGRAAKPKRPRAKVETVRPRRGPQLEHLGAAA